MAVNVVEGGQFYQSQRPSGILLFGAWPGPNCSRYESKREPDYETGNIRRHRRLSLPPTNKMHCTSIIWFALGARLVLCVCLPFINLSAVHNSHRCR